jgi:hypothetical protein
VVLGFARTAPQCFSSQRAIELGIGGLVFVIMRQALWCVGGPAAVGQEFESLRARHHFLIFDSKSLRDFFAFRHHGPSRPHRACLAGSERTSRCVGVPKSARTAPHIIWVPVVAARSEAPIAKVIGLVNTIVRIFVARGRMSSARLAGAEIVCSRRGTGCPGHHNRCHSYDVSHEKNAALHLLARCQADHS